MNPYINRTFVSIQTSYVVSIQRTIWTSLGDTSLIYNIRKNTLVCDAIGYVVLSRDGP